MQTYQFLMLGLEGAGKTTFLYKLRINGLRAQMLTGLDKLPAVQKACLRYKKDDVKQDMRFLKKDKKDPG